MPAHSPTASQVWSGDTWFFCIDTNIIKESGFRFQNGELHALKSQIPENMKILMPEVIFKEIIEHRVRDIKSQISEIKESCSKINLGIEKINGKTKQNIRPPRMEVNTDSIEKESRIFYEQELNEFINELQGEVLHIQDCPSETLSTIFENYFEKRPPFEDRNEKKHEFPDALALETLKQHVHESDSKCIIVSKDKGWKSYAETDKNIYYVSQIKELSSIFIDTTEFPKKISDQVKEKINQEGSVLRKLVISSAETHLQESEWITNELYSDLLGLDIEGIETSVREIQALEEIKTWTKEGAEGDTEMIIEIPLSIEAVAGILCSFYGRDPVDGDYITLSSEVKEIPKHISTSVLLRLENPSDENGDFKNCSPSVEIPLGHYNLGRHRLVPSLD